jgi:hypothetical protein
VARVRRGSRKLCRRLLILDTPNVTRTLESFVAWAGRLIAHLDAVSALTTEIVDMSIGTGTLTRRVQPVADMSSAARRPQGTANQ